MKLTTMIEGCNILVASLERSTRETKRLRRLTRSYARAPDRLTRNDLSWLLWKLQTSLRHANTALEEIRAASSCPAGGPKPPPPPAPPNPPHRDTSGRTAVGQDSRS